MLTHIALLRAVNLGPHNKVAMGDLRRVLEGLGLQDVQTLLQSGNVVFRSATASTTTLERLLADAVRQHLALDIGVFVRTARDWAAIVQANPFPQEAERDPSHLLVMCLRDVPDRSAVAALQKSVKGREMVRARGTTAYLVYPDGIGRSKLTTAAIERGLGSPGTARNWNTVLKLQALAARR